MSGKKTNIGKYIELDSNNLIDIEDGDKYSILGVKSYGKGIMLKRSVQGSELTMRKYQVAKENQVMRCKVDTKNGGFGITNKDHIGSLASSNMALANIKLDSCRPLFLDILFQNTLYQEYITSLSNGTTNRKYIKLGDFFKKVEAPDFTLEEQDSFIKIYENILDKQLFLNNINIDNQDLVKRLRQSILQDAIQGKIVPQDSNDEPASELLKKIASEKVILIEEKKIKKGKELLTITENEKPFSLPNGRTRCKLFEIGESFIGLTYSPNDISENGIPVLRSMNIKDGKIKLDNLVRVTKDVKEKLMVKEGDIIICSRNGSKSLVGKSAIIETLNEPMTFGAFMAILKSPCSKYIQYFMQTNFYRNQLFDANTMTINQITQDMLNNFIIPLPPFAEQHRIVAKVNELMGVCDSLEKEITEAKENGERLMESVLGEVFR